MNLTPEPTSLQLDLREDTWMAPGLTALPWTGGTRAGTTTPSAAPQADCTCPMDCVRDHENE